MLHVTTRTASSNFRKESAILNNNPRAHQRGADITLRDKEAHSALWHARDNDEDEAASLLLAYGAYEEPEEKQN
jgi:ankyrin repeat protein